MVNFSGGNTSVAWGLTRGTDVVFGGNVQTVPNGAELEYDGAFFVAEPGDVLFVASGAADVYYALSGALLQGVT